MLLALFLSAFSLPADIKSRTIYTVVTKPVRTGEIVLGRMLGFTAIGTVLLVDDGGGQLCVRHPHARSHARIDGGRSRRFAGRAGNDAGGNKEGKTSIEHGHSHHVTLDADGNGVTDVVQGHYHHVHAEKDGDKVRYVVGPPEDELIARVPIYVDADDRSTFSIPRSIGQADADRHQRRQGMDVSQLSRRRHADGRDLEIQGHHEGASFPTADCRWKCISAFFAPTRGKSPTRNSSNRADRHSGEHRCSAIPQQPSMKIDRDASSTANDQMIDKRMVLGAGLEREVDGQYQSIGLFKNTPGTARPDLSLVERQTARSEVVLQCLAPSQYIGVARDDVYLKAAEGSFAWNFCKGYLRHLDSDGAGLSFGVTFSTFLSGPVAMLGTLVALVLGFFTADISNLFTAVIRHNYKLVPGGGPIESLIRILGQKTITLELEPSLGVQVSQILRQSADDVYESGRRCAAEFQRFQQRAIRRRRFRYSVESTLGASHDGPRALSSALFLAGHIFLRMRELAQIDKIAKRGATLLSRR